MSAEAELALLRWGVGSLDSVPEDAATSVGDARLLKLIVTHRITARFFDRIRAERPRWASRHLLFSLHQMHQTTKEHLRRQQRALHEILALWPESEGALVVIKGFSSYALTGEERFLRFSGDLDLFPRNKENLYDLLTKTLDYSGEITGSHDWGRMTRGPVRIDITQHFTVSSYPDAVRDSPDAFDPARHPGVWRQPLYNDAPGGTLQYEDFLEDATQGRTPDTRDFLFPDVTMTVFLNMVHSFGHHIGGPCTCFLPQIKIGDLADAYEMAARSDFDPAKFCRLVETFNGQGAVSVLGGLLESLFGRNPFAFALSDDRPPMRRFPQRVAWYGPWVSLYNAAEMILATDAQIPFRRLSPNEILATDVTDAPQWYALSRDTDESRSSLRALLYSDADAFPFRLAAAVTEEELTFRVRLPADSPAGEQYVIHFQYDLSIFREIVLGAGGAPAQGEDKGAGVDILLGERGAQISFSLAELATCRNVDGSYSLLLFLSLRPDMSLADAQWRFPAPVVTLPLRVLPAKPRCE